MDTIFALASARGKAGVAVIRVSGPQSFDAIGRLCSLPSESHTAVVRTLEAKNEVLDQALVLTFKSPNSFTGEDVVELQTHGSPAVINRVLSELGAIPDLRLADPGEFTRRALENNRLDLAQVEGLSDLVEAETEAQRKQAQRIFAGALGSLALEWRTRLIRAASLMEATIDFVDEDVPVDVFPEVVELLSGVSESLEKEINGYAAAERITGGFEVAIIGPPNVGKSTLLNTLAGREAAITSEIAGTTRDVIEVKMDLNGLPVTFLDTAGIRETGDAVEFIGISRALERAKRADLKIVLKESRSDLPSMDLNEDDIELVTKADLTSDGDISGLTGQGIQNLVQKVSDRLERSAAGAGLAIKERHRSQMERARHALGIAQDRIVATPELAELVAEDLRVAIRALDSLVGKVDVEHLLDEIFSAFCIGK